MFTFTRLVLSHTLVRGNLSQIATHEQSGKPSRDK